MLSTSRINENGPTLYLLARSWLQDRGFDSEVQWQSSQVPADVDEQQFLRETAWVIYCSGFKEAVVRKHFAYLSLCFFDWESSRSIAESAGVCIGAAMHSIANKRKHEAIASIATGLSEIGFSAYKRALMRNPVSVLQELPFIGPITALHLAKNLGFNLAKPDRHLVRLHAELGYSSVDEMCASIAHHTGDAIKVIDLVLWRFVEQVGLPSIRID